MKNIRKCQSKEKLLSHSSGKTDFKWKEKGVLGCTVSFNNDTVIQQKPNNLK